MLNECEFYCGREKPNFTRSNMLHAYTIPRNYISPGCPIDVMVNIIIMYHFGANYTFNYALLIL